MGEKWKKKRVYFKGTGAFFLRNADAIKAVE